MKTLSGLLLNKGVRILVIKIIILVIIILLLSPFIIFSDLKYLVLLKLSQKEFR